MSARRISFAASPQAVPSARNWEVRGGDHSDTTLSIEDLYQLLSMLGRTLKEKPGPKHQKPLGRGCSSPPVASMAEQSSKRGEPGWLLTMPLEIIFKILEYVSPGDLASMSMSNKHFHTILTALSSKSVWVTSRRNLNAPAPPDNTSEFGWAKLLFHSNCQVCGASGITSVNWMLRRRACGACKKKHVVRIEEGASSPGGLIEGTIPYILRSNSTKWFPSRPESQSFRHWNFPAKKCAYYWRDDLYAPLWELRTLRNAILNGLPEATANLAAWKEKRKIWVKESIKMSQEYQTWYATLDDQYKSREGAIRAQRLAAVKQRFILLGYSTVDIDTVFDVNNEEIESGPATITDKAWITLRPRLESTLIAQRSWQLEKEVSEIVKPRIEIFQQLYNDFRLRLRPSDKPQLPAYQFLRTLPGLLEHIDAPKSTVVTHHSFRHFIERLPEHITAFWGEYRKAIASQIPEADFNRNFDPTEMARFVFVCDATRVLTSKKDGRFESTDACCTSGLLQGWPMIAQHSSKCEGRHCYTMGTIPKSARRHTIKLDNTHSEVATSLIILAGLDPTSATIADMDHADAFFVCRECSSSPKRTIYSWRQALNRPCRKKSHTQTFFLATGEGRANAIEYRDWLESQRLMWHCNHCPSFSAAGKSNLVMHLQEHHDITNPGSDDLFLNENSRRDLPVYTYAPPPQGKRLYHCLHCVKPEEPLVTRRWFLLDAVLAHLRSSHWIRYPQQDVSYSLAYTPPTSASAL